MAKVLVLATSNPGKLQEFQSYLAGLAWQLELKPPELDIEETGTSFGENARIKALGIAKATGNWAIADDSGLAVAALGGAPGIYSARYGATDQERIQKLLTALGDHPDRRAEFICAVAIASPQGQIVLEAQGVCAGEIIHSPRGNNGFGYDPIFYLPEEQQTFGEMSPSKKDKLSHRGRAFELILPQLAKLELL